MPPDSASSNPDPSLDPRVVAQARLAAIIESSDDAIVSKTLEGVITSWNKGAERIFGWEAHEVIGKSITIIIPQDRLDEEPVILSRIRSGQRVDHFETIRQRKDGQLINISVSVSPVLDGSGRVLYYAKDIWPQFISCVLVAHEKLMRSRPDVVRDLVRGIAESGEWAEQHRIEAAKVVSPYFRQDENLVRFVLTKPPDRVSYRMLDPSDEEMQRIADMALRAGLLQSRVDVRELMDRSFIPKDIQPARIDASGNITPN